MTSGQPLECCNETLRKHPKNISDHPHPKTRGRCLLCPKPLGTTLKTCAWPLVLSTDFERRPSAGLGAKTIGRRTQTVAWRDSRHAHIVETTPVAHWNSDRPVSGGRLGLVGVDVGQVEARSHTPTQNRSRRCPDTKRRPEISKRNRIDQSLEVARWLGGELSMRPKRDPLKKLWVQAWPEAAHQIAKKTIGPRATLPRTA